MQSFTLLGLALFAAACTGPSIPQSPPTSPASPKAEEPPPMSVTAALEGDPPLSRDPRWFGLDTPAADPHEHHRHHHHHGAMGGKP